MKKCKICNTKTIKSFNLKVLNKYFVDYYFCPDCNFIQTENPYWLNEAYRNAITNEDFGLISRNIKYSKITLCIIYFFMEKNGIFLDFAGGYGIFTNVMRVFNLKFLHYDPYCQNIFAKDFFINKFTRKFELITAFEYFEHDHNPIKSFKKLINNTNFLIFSTELHEFKNTNDINMDWFYFYPIHGQHISFYSASSLKLISEKFNMNYYSNNKNYHIFSKKKLSNLKLKIIFKFYEILYLYPRKRLK